MATVAQSFQQLGLPQWWNDNVSQFFNGGSEMGTDFNLGGFGKPVGSITPGKIVYVGDGGYPGSSIGQIVQVLAPDGRLFHYQHLKTSQVHVGDTVSVGTVVGTGGGCPVGAYGSGISCTRTDQYSTGEHIEVRVASSYKPGNPWSQSWVDPINIFKQIGGATASSVASSGTLDATGSSGGSSSDWVKQIQGGSVKAGIFILGLVLAGAGFYLLFSKQVNAGVKTAAKVALL